MTHFALALAFAAVNVPLSPAAPAQPEPPPVVEQPAPVARASRIAVYELKAEGVDARTALVVTEALVAELRKLQRTSVVSMDEVKQMLDHEAQKQLVGCSDESCLAEIADSLGVDGLVVGTLARLQDEHIVGVKRLDQRAGAVVGSATRRLEAGDGSELLAAVGPLVEELFPDVPLRPGAKRGVDEAIVLRLHPPPVPTWAYWSTAVATGTVAAGAIGAAVWNSTARADHDAFVGSTLGGAAVRGVDVRAKQDAVALTAVSSWVLIGGALAGGGALVLMAPLTDWDGLAAGGAQ